jgi:hypothetical protein
MGLSGTEILNPPKLSTVPWGKDDGLSAEEEYSPKTESVTKINNLHCNSMQQYRNTDTNMCADVLLFRNARGQRPKTEHEYTALFFSTPKDNENFPTSTLGIFPFNR